MRLLVQLVGFGLLILGIYFLGKNIIFTTNVSPYFWSGIAADASVLALIAGVLMLVFMRGEDKKLGWIAIAIGIVLVFVSSRAVLNPTSLWQFFLAFLSLSAGYKMFTTGRLPF